MRVLILAVVTACMGWAQAQWAATGPYGGSAELIRVVPRQPEHAIAATANGLVYESRNGGASWTRLPFPGQFSGTLHALELDPQAPGTWYLGMESENSTLAGVYKTSDAGATWTLLPGLKGESVWSLAVWPGDSKWIAAGTGSGVFLTRDAGATWSRISPESNGELRPVVSLAFDPADRGVIYAGTTHLPWRTRDGGANWESIHTGMLDDSDVFSIASPARAPGSVFASACSGVYRSPNGGASWKRLNTPSGAFRAYLVAVDPAHAGVVFAATSAGLLRSADEGATWKTVSPHAVKSIAFDPANTEKIFFASSTGGILLSRDGGRTVAEFNTGFSNRNFTAAGGSGATLYAASVYEPGSGGIFRAGDYGLRWQRFAGPGGGENVIHLSAAPDDSKLLFAAGYGGLFRSADGGGTWTKPEDPPGGAITALAAESHGKLLAGTSDGLFTLSGSVWSAVKLPGLHGGIQQLQPSTGGVMAALGATGAFRGEDGGSRWTACGQPVPGTVWYGLAFEPSLEPGIEPKPGGNALAATSRGLFRSTDGCATWNLVHGGLAAATVSAVVYHPERRGEAFAAQSGRVLRSTDGGTTWAPLDAAADAYPTSLFILPGAPYRLFALFPRLGVLSHTIEPATRALTDKTSHSHP